MSESNYPPRTPTGVAHPTGDVYSGLPPDLDATTPLPTGSPRQGSTAHEAASQASDVASHAGDAAKGLAQETGQKAGEVAGEAKERARDLVWQARQELRGQAEVQQQRMAGGLRAFGDELTQMSASRMDPGYAADLAERAGDLSRRAASWFEDRDPGSVLTEVQDFARRRPGLFLAVAAGAGLLAGRLARGLKDADSSEPGYRRTAWAGPGVAGTGSAYATGTSGYPTATGDPLADQLDVPTSPNRPWTGGADDVERP